MVPASYKGKTVAVLGLGKSGISTLRALESADANVLAWDDKSDRDDLVDLTKADWSQIDLLVMSPGIPHTYPKAHPVADLARAHNVDIVCDVELLVQAQPQAQYVAITGTNGKSTTTALIAHILEICGFTVEVGGNLGIPVLDLAPLEEDGIYVLEMSSYQLERTPSLCADVAIWMNISPDHLD
ncbi:MAG: UDP-N-acetylmuramoyl-L-alanine--D-glutamate ligase, partial [Methylocystaceae bacterium]|nr:UDP-N-acetylmuramoyl-L-alanine--D-glutamate ligase [Methylocystaceae bacterium]